MEHSRIVIGGMRFTDERSAADVIRKAVDCGFNYIDSSPLYCRKGDAPEGSEEWTGKALRDPAYRNRIMVSTKCSPGDGGLGLGEFRPELGFGVRSKEQLLQVFDQSLRRMQLDRFDWYHLWTTHTMEQIHEAMKPGGWMDGVMACRGKWSHLGLTSHADSGLLIEFLKLYPFESLTIPLNVINTTRLKAVKHCNSIGIPVIAMNPFAGGLLASHEKLKELSLRYLMRLDVHPLIGFSRIEEVEYAKWIEDTMEEYPLDAEGILREVDSLIDTSEQRCTACGYCTPCPRDINVGAALSYYNLYKYVKMDSAREAFQQKQWDSGLNLSNCAQCGICESRCPNKLPVMSIIRDARNLMYDREG